MAGEHVNVLMADRAPATRHFIVDLREAGGWVEVDEFESLQDAVEARRRMVAVRGTPEADVRVRGERSRRLWTRGSLTVLAALALVNLALYVAMLTVD